MSINRATWPNRSPLSNAWRFSWEFGFLRVAVGDRELPIGRGRGESSRMANIYQTVQQAIGDVRAPELASDQG